MRDVVPQARFDLVKAAKLNGDLGPSSAGEVRA
jgi:hypothetical protein